MKYHHIGLVTTEVKPGEVYYESLKVFGTNPDNDPVNRIEWLRFLPDGPLAKTAVAAESHIAYLVDNLDEALKGKAIVVPPTHAAPNIRIAYFRENGLLIEYLEVK